MRKYKTEEYVREDGKTVIIERCTNPHWDAMPGEFDKITLYDPVKAEKAKDWEDVWSLKIKNGRRTWMYSLVGTGLIIAGIVGEIFILKILGKDFPRPGPAWSYAGVLVCIAGLIMIIARQIYVGGKQNPYTCIKCPFPEDPGAF